MRFRQPDVEWKSTCFCSKSHKHADTCRIEDFFFLTRTDSWQQFRDSQGSKLAVQKEQSHQHDQSTDDCNCQISSCRPQRFLIFFLCHPHIGSKRHDFKENKGGIQICRQKYAHRCAECQKQKQIKSVPILMMLKILSGKKCSHHPHQSRHHAINHTKSVQYKIQTESTDFGNKHLHHAFPACTDTSKAQKPQKHCQSKLTDHHKFCQVITIILPVSSCDIGKDSTEKRIKYKTY